MADNTPPESTYPQLDKPEFTSKIPPHLLDDASPAEAHILGELSKLGQFAEWSTRAHLLTHDAVRRTNGRLIKAEGDIDELADEKKSFVSGWRAIVAVTGFLAGAISFLILVYQAFN